MIGLKKIRATKTFSTNHNSPAFFRAWNQLHVFASCSDWFTELTTCFLIGQNKPIATFPHLFPAPRQPATWMNFPWILIGLQSKLHALWLARWPIRNEPEVTWRFPAPRSSHWFSELTAYIVTRSPVIINTYTAALGSFVVSHHSACFLISCLTFFWSLLPIKS